MGIRKYHNKWRVYAHDKAGNKVQEYLPTKALAQARYDELTAGKNRMVRNKKRSTAKHQELPVGLEEYTYTSKVNCASGSYENHYVAIRASVFMSGKVKYFMRNFGLKRTRNEAIAICYAWRLKMVELIESS